MRAIADQLQKDQLSDHLYSVLFSYVLDGLTWDQLRASKAIPEMKISADHPFWDGTFWAVYPIRAAQPGTNSTGPDGVTILMTWTDPVLGQLTDLENAPALEASLKQIAKGDCRNLSIDDAAHTRWNLSTEEGKCAFPVIHENENDAIYAAGRRIAGKIVDSVLQNDFQTLIGGGSTAEQAHLIEAHELIWSVLDLLEKDGLVREPAVLRNGAPSHGRLLQLLLVAVQH